jgi:5'-nucleotidase / UDP-sugar diphosphatase
VRETRAARRAFVNTPGYARLRMRSILVPLLCATAGVAQESAPASRPTIPFVILHTNDVHGQIRPLPDPRSREGAPRLAGGYQELVSAIDDERSKTAHSILVDAGDWWQGTPEGTLSRGRCSVELMNAAGYDLAVVGNHDFDGGPAALLDLLRLARFPVLGANVGASDDSDLTAVAVERLVRTAPVLAHVEGFAIAFAGVVTEETPRITAPRALKGMFVAPEISSARAARAMVRLPADRGGAPSEGAVKTVGRDDADALVFVNHVARDRNVELARAMPEIDVVIGGHFHAEALPEGVVVPSTGALIAQAGSHTRSLGVVTLEIDLATRRIVKKSARLRTVEPRADATVPRIAPIVARYEAAVAETMNVPVADVPASLFRGADLERPGALGAWLAEAMLARTGADLAIHNHGGIRADLPAGRARVRELFQISPFGNRLVTVRMKVSDLCTLARQTAANPSRGFVFGGVEVVARKKPAGPPEIVELRKNGATLADDATVTVATTDFLALARDGAAVFCRATDFTDRGETLLDATIAYARGQKTVVAPASTPWSFIP